MDGAGDDDVEERVTVLPSTETDGPGEEEEPSVTEEQWTAMTNILNYLYGYRREDGSDPSKVFHKRVNKRQLPNYYEVIKEPMAFSNLKQSSQNRDYKSFKDFIRDCALIWHNAHTYNRPDAIAYVDASTIKQLMEEQFQKLVEQGTISSKDAEWPDLGEIPPVEDPPEDEEEEEEEDADADADADADGDGEGEDEDEDDEVDDSDEDAPRRRKSGRPSTSRRDTKSDGTKGEPDAKKRRGRPPKVDTPMEARMKNVLKGIRKPKNEDGVIMVHSFEKLPDKTAMPEYYAEIRNPISIEQIKKYQKRKRYKSVDNFMKDIDLMFENAKLFNEDESQIYKDAVFLQKEAHRLAEIEKKKSDDEFVMEEGRKPRPDGITHNGELWKVGDWVHIRNANDISKPIVAQIYRTWEDASGSPWVNACWYYRPEQTVHHYEKHFFPHEVVKTGQYRDHPIDDVIDRCFVMFFTRYSRGRPRGIPADRDVYVCEARYNEEKFKMNKIKTWASCLPDEVRDKDYEMDMFDGVKKVKKVPSPLLHLLKEDEKDEEPSKPRWGVENAPPILGGIYRGPRDENQSPPPEPTPSPPPQPPPPPPRQATQTPNHESPSFRRAQDFIEQAGRPFGQPPDQMNASPHPASYTPQSRHYQQSAASPVPPQYQQQQQSQQHTYGQQTSQSHNYTPGSMHSYEHYGTQQNRYQPSQRYPTLGAQQASTGQRSENVFVLPDSANSQIPEYIRDQYHCDAEGRVMFFTHPPLDVLQPANEGASLGHSLKYKAARIRRERLIKERNEQAAREKEAKEKEPNSGSTSDGPAKRAKSTGEAEKENRAKSQAVAFETAVGMSVEEWAKQMNNGTDKLLKSVYQDNFEEGKRLHNEKLLAYREDSRKRAREDEEAAIRAEEKQAAKGHALWSTPKFFLDDGHH